jgi:hypothetical protein
MLRLFSNSEYIDMVFAYGEVCGSAPRAQKFSVRLLVGVHCKLTQLKFYENGWKMLPQQFAITEVCLKE